MQVKFYFQTVRSYKKKIFLSLKEHVTIATRPQIAFLLEVLVVLMCTFKRKQLSKYNYYSLWVLSIKK